jgi:hypothetical protein
MNGAGGSPKDRVALSMIKMVHFQKPPIGYHPAMVVIFF